MPQLSDRHLYLCVPVREDIESFLRGVLRGGVDIVQLREKELGVDVQRSCAELMVPICRDFGVPFIMNDSPELALAVGADGVHVGQDDVTVKMCRELLGSDAIVGLSTHSRDEFDAALDQPATYFSAGPIAQTPTKPGRSGTGVSYAVQSQARSDRPVFVTGGVNSHNVAELVADGLRHFVVVRALTESPNPEESARSLRRALDEALSTVPVEPT
ncbi:MAG TPA: thiamine phosphate synthase [Acidimicrobiales bacterium]